MTRWTPRTVTPVLLGGCLAAAPLAAQRGPDSAASIVIVTGQEASVPVPTLMEGPHASIANSDIADQLFLHLASLGPTLITAGDRAFEPLLARRWTRRDSVTLVFELDPRATWHDGVPVTAEDVVFTFARARDPKLAPRLATLLRRIASVTADDPQHVVFRFTEPYAEQLYDAVFHVAPLPAHLLARVAPESLALSPYVEAPVGNGAYRWVRRVPGEYLELAAYDRFFLGAPAIRRVIFRVAADADARLNLVLGGEADALDNVPPPASNLARVEAVPSLRAIPFPSPTLGFLLFNQRDPNDRERPHPILADSNVRRAIILALDRRQMVRAVLGTRGEVPFGPASPILWIRHGAPPALGRNPAEARRLLAASGWLDHDGDGILDRGGQPLALTLTLPSTSAVRQQFALQVQAQLREVGIRLDLERLDGAVWNERRTAGRFDIDFSATSQDPSPGSLSQGWSCTGGTNVARFCDPVVDSLLAAAGAATDRAREAWHAVLRRIEADAPAAFLYAPTYVAVVPRRFDNVRLRPESLWLALREWAVKGAPARLSGY